VSGLAPAGQYEVAQAVGATLWQWLPTHTVAWARTRGVSEADLTSGKFPFRATELTIVSAYSQWAMDAGLPHVQVMSGSWQAAPGDETGKAGVYEIHVAVLVAAQDHSAALLRRACFEDGIRDTLAKHADIGGLASGVTILGGGPAQLSDVNPEDARTLQGSVVVAEFMVPHIYDPFSGPAASTPLPDVAGVPPVPPTDPVFPPDTDPDITFVADDLGTSL
jgi:hypothetical protein